jgi:hypothetical protein
VRSAAHGVQGEGKSRVLSSSEVFWAMSTFIGADFELVYRDNRRLRAATA